MWENIGRSQTWESKEQKLLGVIIDRYKKFDEYILIQCKKVGRKLCVLGRERRRSLMKTFIKSQHIALLYGCSVAEVQIIVLILCLNEHEELFTMITFQHLKIVL